MNRQRSWIMTAAPDIRRSFRIQVERASQEQIPRDDMVAPSAFVTAVLFKPNVALL
jgi:hypothetical protein